MNMNIYRILLVTFGMLGAFTSIAQTNNTDKLDIEICGVVSRTYELGLSLGEGDISNWDNTPLRKRGTRCCLRHNRIFKI